jgi:hypothetical protein
MPGHVLVPGRVEDEDPGDVVLEERVDDAVAYALAVEGDDGDFAALVGGQAQGEAPRRGGSCGFVDGFAAELSGDIFL